MLYPPGERFQKIYPQKRTIGPPAEHGLLPAGAGVPAVLILSVTVCFIEEIIGFTQKIRLLIIITTIILIYIHTYIFIFNY